MNDEMFDRQYQAGRKDLHAGVARMARRVGTGFAATFDSIKRVQFSAPWSRNDVRPC